MTTRLPVRHLKRPLFARALKEAKREIARFAELLGRIPNPGQVLFTLKALESMAAIESQRVHLAFEEFCLLLWTRSRAKKDSLQLLDYYQALERACADIATKPLNQKMLCTIQRLVIQSEKRKASRGHYRTKQNWLGPKGCKKEEAYFFPPPPQQVPRAMRHLLAYCQKKTRNPLVQIATAFAQLLIIHPFMDGNGRTARLFAPLFLFKKGVLPCPLLFMSRYLKDHRKTYFQKLFGITEKHHWEKWINFFLKGVAQQSKKSTRLASRLHILYERLRKELGEKEDFLSYLFAHPIFSVADFTQRYSTGLLKQLVNEHIVKLFRRHYAAFSPLLKLIEELLL